MFFPIQAKFDQAIEANRSGRPDIAVKLFRQIVCYDPCHAETLHNLGVMIDARSDNIMVGSALIRHAINIENQSASYFYNLGISFLHIGKIEESIDAYHRAITLDISSFMAWTNLGVALQKYGELRKSFICFHHTVRLQPVNALAHSNMAIVLRELNKTQMAVLACKLSIIIGPEHRVILSYIRDIIDEENNIYSSNEIINTHRDYSKYLICSGNILVRHGLLVEGLTQFRKSVIIDPAELNACLSISFVKEKMKQHDEAIKASNKAAILGRASTTSLENQENPYPDEVERPYHPDIILKPDSCSPYTNFAGFLKNKYDSLQYALIICNRALTIEPNNVTPHINRGAILQVQNRMEESKNAYLHAIILQPENHVAFTNMGSLHVIHGMIDEARKFLRRSLTIQPDDPHANIEMSLLLMGDGDLENALPLYEWRWQSPLLLRKNTGQHTPQWNGEAGNGERLLIHTEQGYGDIIQFCRYAPMVAMKGFKVVMTVPHPLFRLMKSLAGIDKLILSNDQIPEHDLHCPIMSLPFAFKTNLETIPAFPAYLFADKKASAIWRKSLVKGFKIGIAWSGNDHHNFSDNRLMNEYKSIKPSLLSPLFSHQNIHFFSLQKDEYPFPAAHPLIDLMDIMDDFADTAALIDNLDLVISVDTAVVHLAAALGKSVWLLSRHSPQRPWFRNRNDSPWYPSLRIFQQPRPGDWETVIKQVCANLEKFSPSIKS